MAKGRLQLGLVLAGGVLLGALFAPTLRSVVFSSPVETASPGSASAPSRRGGGRGGARGGYLPAISVEAAKSVPLGRSLSAIGEARALQGATIVAETAGRVEAVYFQPGQPVKKGDILLRLDDREQRIALERAEAQYPVAKENAERYRVLEGDNAASAIEADNAFNAYKSLEAELRSARFTLDQRRIRAPFDGIAGLTDIEPGDFVRVGDPVLTLDDVSAVIVEFLVPQEATVDVVVGQAVEARLSGVGTPFSGEISAIDSRVDPASRTIRVEATLPGGQNAILPGATVMIETTNITAQAIAAPSLAVQWDRSGAFVWRIGAGGVAEQVRVVIRQRRDDLVLVEGDLAEGDLIVSESADRVRPGMSFPQFSAVDNPVLGAAEPASAAD